MEIVCIVYCINFKKYLFLVFNIFEIGSVFYLFYMVDSGFLFLCKVVVYFIIDNVIDFMEYLCICLWSKYLLNELFNVCVFESY